MVRIDKAGILEWLDDYFKDDRERIINNAVEQVEKSIESHNLEGYNNSLNSFADVFDLVYAFVKIDVALNLHATDKEIEDYNTLTGNPSDLPSIVFRVLRETFTYVKCSKEDVKYCEYFIDKHRNVWSFKKK